MVLLLSDPPVKMSARAFKESKTHARTRTSPPFCSRRVNLSLKAEAKLFAVELTKNSITNCHLCSHQLSDHIAAPPLPALLLIGSPRHPLRCTTPDWLALPAPNSEAAVWTNGDVCCVQKGREEQAAGVSLTATGGKRLDFWEVNGHIWPLCVGRKLQAGRFGWRLHAHRHIPCSLIPHAPVCLTQRGRAAAA